jgi:hypothetical protein
MRTNKRRQLAVPPHGRRWTPREKITPLASANPRPGNGNDLHFSRLGHFCPEKELHFGENLDPFQCGMPRFQKGHVF